MIILEVGCNHRGEFDTAKLLIDAAVVAGADAVKFQKRNNKELLPKDQYDAPHPVPENSYGATYGEHREFLEFSKEQHAELKAYCESKGIEYSTSVWDVTSAQEIASLNPKFIKIPSASNLHFDMLGVLCDTYAGEIHLSLGMTTHQEEEEIVEFFEKRGKADSLVLYACTSGYPVPAHEVCLLEITRLQKKFGNRVKSIAFSGHHISTVPDIAAFALGASHVERHFTIDRNWKGTDHSASLEPIHAIQLVRDVNEVKSALQFKEKEVLDIEEQQRKKLKWK
jgi:N-acetylneuraminate synthase